MPQSKRGGHAQGKPLSGSLPSPSQFNHLLADWKAAEVVRVQPRGWRKIDVVIQQLARDLPRRSQATLRAEVASERQVNPFVERANLD